MRSETPCHTCGLPILDGQSGALVALGNWTVTEESAAKNEVEEFDFSGAEYNICAECGDKVLDVLLAIKRKAAR